MDSIGQQLKAARESRNKSLEEVANDLYVSKKYLKALESDSYDVFPAHVYCRGFLVAYARYLEMDHEAIGTEYDKVVGLNGMINKEKSLEEEYVGDLEPRKKGKNLRAGIVSIAVVVFIALCVLLYIWLAGG